MMVFRVFQAKHYLPRESNYFYPYIPLEHLEHARALTAEMAP